MKIFDCFCFFNELELLDFRLMVLNEIVDYFVIVESNRTFTGNDKEFIYDLNKHKFSKYEDKIIYIKVEDGPAYSEDDHRGMENFQRDCIMRGLKDVAKTGDKIIVSDVDEIPNPDIVTLSLSNKQPVIFEQHLFYYYINYHTPCKWRGSVLFDYSPDIYPKNMRSLGRHGPKKNIVVGGWHYSYMGGPDRIKSKIDNLSDSYLVADKVGDIEEIKSKIFEQKDLWSRTAQKFKGSIINLQTPGMAPKCVDNFIFKYPDFFFVGG